MPDAICREIIKSALKFYMQRKYYTVKTIDAYIRQMRSATLDLYRGDIDEFGFIDVMVNIIENQFGRAWREGAREAGVDPRDFTDEDLQALQDLITAEQEFILSFALAVTDARDAGTPVSALYYRVDMWANRYNEVKNEAMLRFSKDRLEWVYGDTDHCEDCRTLNGIVATADEWLASGWQPQSYDLECHGFNCQCQLLPTDKPRTRRGIPPK